ncbi:uncharacterized protein LOC132626566 [Lycium barbarum]|uniref:uncharacterized protein LOC132626566 n=1 Tax=Lycium barbarum TaxID=112863 RepID=UPI00293F422B|nr:uncharacterized protein LOC132626566 [Lycium barbarum]
MESNYILSKCYPLPYILDASSLSSFTFLSQSFDRCQHEDDDRSSDLHQGDDNYLIWVLCGRCKGRSSSLVARSTTKGFPTAEASEKTASLAKKLGGNSGKLIHATAIEVSSFGLNQGFQISDLI